MALSRMKREARERIEQAIDRHEPTKVFALFSGGGDSQVSSHVALPYIDALVHIDTGTAPVDEQGTNLVRGFVDDWAEHHRAELLVYEAGRAFEWLVTRRCAHLRFEPLGFPGYGQHGTAYYYLKQKQIDRLIREHKTHHAERFLLITGVRNEESARRALIHTTHERRDGAKVWVNPILDWGEQPMAHYRRRYRLSPSDVTALLHMSGECLCGAFAKPGEREMLMSLFPRWGNWILDMEREAARVGSEHPVWGWGNLKGPAAPEEPPVPGEFINAAGELCTSCVTRAEAA